MISISTRSIRSSNTRFRRDWHRHSLRGRRLWLLAFDLAERRPVAVVLAAMMIPFRSGLVPLFIIFKNISWINTYLPLVVPAFQNTFSSLLRQDSSET